MAKNIVIILAGGVGSRTGLIGRNNLLKFWEDLF